MKVVQNKVVFNKVCDVTHLIMSYTNSFNSTLNDKLYENYEKTEA